jgi:hypothetical protein
MCIKEKIKERLSYSGWDELTDVEKMQIICDVVGLFGFSVVLIGSLVVAIIVCFV